MHFIIEILFLLCICSEDESWRLAAKHSPVIVSYDESQSPFEFTVKCCTLHFLVLYATISIFFWAVKQSIRSVQERNSFLSQHGEYCSQESEKLQEFSITPNQSFQLQKNRIHFSEGVFWLVSIIKEFSPFFYFLIRLKTGQIMRKQVDLQRSQQNQIWSSHTIYSTIDKRTSPSKLAFL